MFIRRTPDSEAKPKRRRRRRRESSRRGRRTRSPDVKDEEEEQEIEPVEKKEKKRRKESPDMVREANLKAEPCSPSERSESPMADYGDDHFSLEEEAAEHRREMIPEGDVRHARSSGSGVENRRPRSPDRKRPQSPGRRPAKRKDWTEEERRQDNKEARERKIGRRNLPVSLRRAKGKENPRRENRKEKEKVENGATSKPLPFDGWACAAGDLPDPVDGGMEVVPEDPESLEVVSGPPVEAEAAAGGSEEGLPQPVVAADEPVAAPLNENSRVTDLRTRLKELGAPVWGDKPRLWERLQEYEVRRKATAETEAILKAREEALN
jgi:hypothetical protein